MSVPAGKRKQSRFEAQHHFYRLRQEVTTLMMLDFGFSEEKYRAAIERYRESHRNAQDVDAVTARYERKCVAFKTWFIDQECGAISKILRQIECEFTMGNAIYPSETAAKLMEYCERRRHIDAAIGACYCLKQELQYVIRTLPVDLNKYTRFSEAIDMQISLYKGVRQADNRFLRPKKQTKKQ